MSLNSEEFLKIYGEQESRWVELGKLGMGQALLDHYGVDPGKQSRMMQLVHKTENDRTIEVARSLDRILGIDHGLGVVLATLGRDSDTIDLLQITMWEVRLHIGNRTTIFQPLKVREHDLFALLVNLASSPKIRNVTLFVQSQALCSPANCIALEKAIASNTTLKELVIHHSSSQQRKNLSTVIDKDSLYGQYHYKPLTVPALSRLVEGLRRNTTLETLEITTYPEDIDWVAKTLVATARATSQEELSIIYVPAADAAAASTGNEADLPTSSRINRSLKCFEFTAAEPSESTWTHLLAPFVPDGPDDREKCTIVTRLFFSAFPSSGIRPLCSVLRTNKTLKVVGLRHCQFSTREWAEQIMIALQANECVEHLDLSFSLGLTDEGVFGALMNLAQFTDSHLTSICVIGTGLENKAGAIIEELRGKNQNRALLKAQASTVPAEGTSPKAGRIVLCGSPFAGKTSICNSLQQRHDSFAERLICETAQQESTLPSHRGPGPQLLRKHANGRGSTSDLHDGTRNLSILLLTGDHDPRSITSIWDFAGQSKYHILHDYCFPNAGNSCFLYVCSAKHAPDRDGNRGLKNQQSIQEEFRYWMCFLASKSKQVKDERGQKTRPHVTFVLTGKDVLNTEQQNESRSFAKNTVDNFREDFKTVLDISSTLEFIDAHSEDDVARIFFAAKDHLDVILNQSVLAIEHEVCWRFRDGVQRWLSDPKNPAPQPILKLEQVEKLCVDDSLHERLQNLREKEGPPVSDKFLIESPFKEGLKIVLRYLNDAGDIIFVEKGLDLVVVSPGWLVAGVFGSLIDAVHGIKGQGKAAVGARSERRRSSLLGCLNPKTKSLRERTPDNDENGYFFRSTLDECFNRSLEKISFYQAIFDDTSLMIPLMLHLDMCFEKVPLVGEEMSKNRDARFFVPVLLGDGGGDKPSKKVLKWSARLPQAQSVCFVGRRLECEDKSLTFLSPGFFPRLQVILSNYFREQNWLDTEHFTLSQNLLRFAKNDMDVILEYSGNIDSGSFLDVLVRSTNDPEQTIGFIRNHVEKQIFEFCSSPKGCPGVTLVEAVIRPVCVEKLFSCEDRKEHAILVSTLDNYVRQRGKEYRHTWTHPIAGESDQDLAIELLQGGFMARLPQLDLGEGASSKRGKSRFEEFPVRIKLTTEDVHLAQKFEAKMNPTRKLPVILHLLCDGLDSDDPHEISDQPGRVLHLPESSKGCNIPVLRHVVNLLYEGGKVAAGFFNVQSVRQIDSFVATLFRTPDMDIDNIILEGIMGRPGTQSDSSHVTSKEELVRKLETYMHMNPSTEWLKQFLNLPDVSAFLNDFKLRKVQHNDTKEIFWLCDNHFIAGLRNGKYKSVPH